MDAVFQEGLTDDFRKPSRDMADGLARREQAVKKLHREIVKAKNGETGTAHAGETAEAADAVQEALWQAVIEYQCCPFYTSSGLPFSYTVKRKRNGEYSGELKVSRKEGSKTLTRSSVMLAFCTVLEKITVADAEAFVPPAYKGPKAIGQIFGISYVYSLFWNLGLIRIPEKLEARINGKP